MTTPQITLENPLNWGLEAQRVPRPCAMVIFGATGDLNRRKLMPALYRLSAQRQLPAGFTVIGVGRRDIGDDQFRRMMHDALIEHKVMRSGEDPLWLSFAQGIRYVQSGLDDPAGYEHIAAALADADTTRGTGGNRLYYLATPPESFPLIIHHLGEAGLNHAPGDGWSRVIIEKPFGTDLASARALNQHVLSVFDESQVYRI